MQLEKASSRAGEAGWISSNDVTLFTVVMVVVVAIFLQANVIKGSRKNEQLEGEKSSLSDRLTETDDRLQQTQGRLQMATAELEEKRQSLESTQQQLQTTREDLAATIAQRDALEQTRKELEQKLATTRREVKELSDALDALNLEKSHLLAARDQLAEEKDELAKQKTDLSKAKAELDEDLMELTAKLKERVGQLDDLKKERDLLDQKAKALTDRVARLESQLDESEEHMADLKQSSQSEMENLQQLLARALERQREDQTASAKEIREAQTAARQAQARAEDYLDRLRRAAVYVEGLDEKKNMLALQVDALKVQLANALDDLEQARQQLSQRIEKDKSLNRELVGLRGKLRRVAILFDSSGSMGQSGRWEEVQRIAATWLDYLEVDECVLILFASDVRTFPADGSMLRVSGPDGDANRARLMTHLRSVQPEGWTNTLAAMQKAYQYEDLDTVILFSDGAPTYQDRNEFNAEAARQIYALCRQHADVPVNAIGLGNYFDESLSTFLRTVAHTTGGTFLGR